MKFWKKIWIEELDKSVPSLDENIKNMPIGSGTVTNVNGNGTAAVSKKPMIVILASVMAVILLGIILTCVFVFRPAADLQYAFAIEINPAVTVTTDANGTVTAIISSNSDADVILSNGDAESQIGKPIAEVAAWYTDRAAMLGYIDLSEKGSAVRISACENGSEILQNAQAALQNYLMDKGIFAVVLGETVSTEEFSIRCGINANSMSELISAVSRSATLFNDRLAQAAENAEALASLYTQNVLSSNIMHIIKERLSSNIANIEKNANDIKDLLKLYLDILSHRDNPALILGDYWFVKSNYSDRLEGEFADLMAEMDDSLERYESNYGMKIISIDDLRKASECYVLLSVDQIKAVIADLSAELLKQYSSALTDILELIGLSDDPITNLLQAPQTLQEFLSSLYSALSVEFEYRKTATSSQYDGLQSIDIEEYSLFVQNILNEYGSLDRYWDAIK